MPCVNRLEVAPRGDECEAEDGVQNLGQGPLPSDDVMAVKYNLL